MTRSPAGIAPTTACELPAPLRRFSPTVTRCVSESEVEVPDVDPARSELLASELEEPESDEGEELDPLDELEDDGSLSEDPDGPPERYAPCTQPC